MSPVTLYLAPDGDTPHEDPLDAVDEQLPLSGHDDGETVTVEEWAHVATLTYEAHGMDFVLRSRVERTDSHPASQQESSPPVGSGAVPGGDSRYITLERLWYIAKCCDCQPPLPMPFLDADSRDGWAIGHRSIGHKVNTYTEPRS